MLLSACWLSIAGIYGTMAFYHDYLPTMFVHTAPTSLCNMIKPLPSLQIGHCAMLCIYAILLAIHSLIWRSITSIGDTSLHKRMQSAANFDLRGFALLFFNMKQFYLWSLQSIELKNLYPDPMLQLVAYTECACTGKLFLPKMQALF